MDYETKWILGMVTALLICGTIVVTEMYYTIPEMIETAERILIEETGLVIQEVTINSPTFYIEYEELSEFLKAVDEKDADMIYTDGFNYGQFYVVFNKELTIGYRIYVSSVDTHEKRSTQ